MSSFTPANYLQAFSGKHVMITGGMGFIGSNLARALLQLEAQVVLVDSLIPTYGGNLFNINGLENHLRVNIADVRDENSMDYLVRGQDFIFNLAGQISHFDSMLDPYTDLDINCRSQLSILEACRKNNPGVKVVYASTRQMYGQPVYLPVDENHPVQPVDVNGINKMAGEQYHILYNNVYGLRATSLRMTNTFGPRQWMRDNRLTSQGWFLRLVLDNQEVQLFGDGSQLRDLTYVDDAIDAFLRAAALDEANGQAFNLGGEISSLRQQVELMIEQAQTGSYRLVPWPPEKQKIAIGDFYADYTKISKILGWEPRTSTAEGLRRTIEFYREHKEHYW
jgi:UDP-glucose 4-epimerase